MFLFPVFMSNFSSSLFYSDAAYIFSYVLIKTSYLLKHEKPRYPGFAKISITVVNCWEWDISHDEAVLSQT